MTRIAEALRRSRELTFDGSGAPQTPTCQEDDAQSWLTALPSELDAPQPSTTQPMPPLPAPPSGRSRALPDIGHGWREELAPIVRCMLQDGSADTRIRSVLFTAIAPEHSAAPCAAVADALARQTSGSVCVLDGNLRAPSLHTSFGLRGTAGISELLLRQGTARAYLTKLTPNLWLLPAGTLCAEAVPVLAGAQMREHLRALLATFDYVLVDTSAASVHSDAVTLGILVDAVVLVIGANATRREVAKRTIDRLRASHVNVLGAILTNRDFPIPETLYRML